MTGGRLYTGKTYKVWTKTGKKIKDRIYPIKHVTLTQHCVNTNQRHDDASPWCDIQAPYNSFTFENIYDLIGYSKKVRGEEVDRRRDGKTIIKSGQEWTFPAQLGHLKTGQDGKELLRGHHWCPDNIPRLWNWKEIEYIFFFISTLLYGGSSSQSDVSSKALVLFSFVYMAVYRFILNVIFGICVKFFVFSFLSSSKNDRTL